MDVNPKFGGKTEKVSIHSIFFFFTFLLGSKGRGAPRSSPGFLGAPQACTSTPTSGVPMQASDEDDRERNGHRIVQL